MREVNVWLYACPGCRYMKSSLTPGVGAPVEGIEYLRRRISKRCSIVSVVTRPLRMRACSSPVAEKGGFSKPRSVAG